MIPKDQILSLRPDSARTAHLTGLWILLVLMSVPWHGYAKEPTSAVAAAVTELLAARIADPSIDITVDILGNTLIIENCDTPTPFLAREDASLWGRITMGLHCDNPPSPRFLQARVIAQGDILIAATDISAGTTIDATMLTVAPGRLGESSNRTLREPNQAVGMEARQSISIGSPLQERLLTAPVLVERGQPVTLEVRGQGFSVTRDARAMDSGGLGEMVRVKLSAGTTLSATVTGLGRTTASH